MVEQVVNWPLSSGRVLSAEAQERKHCQAAIFDLLQLQLSKVALRHTHGIKDATWITGNAGTSKVRFKAKEGTRLSLATGLLYVLPAFDLSKVEEEEHSHKK